MPRPLRIEYENAYYHVMNRGRGRQRIFHSDDYFHAFLECLEQAHARFGLQVLCYCLMSNHYHLLVKTPESNLGRIMRHINGIYTQRYNRLRRTDGSLFRGRYKAICVETDSYQLQLSRYIHRNPLEARVVDDLEKYPWSSYLSYISNTKTPEWLYQADIFGQLGARSRRRERYKSYVEQGIDEEIRQFYSKGNQVPYLGSDGFREWAYQQRLTREEDVSQQAIIQYRPTIDEIVKEVATKMNVIPVDILKGGRGHKQTNLPRQVAMYLCQERSDHRLKAIAEAFGLKRYGSVADNISKLKRALSADRKLRARLKSLI